MLKKEQKKFHNENRYKLSRKSIYFFTASCGLVGGPSTALSDLLWFYMAFYGITWPYIVFLLSFMVLNGLFMATHRFGLVGSFLAVVNPNLFGLVPLQ